ncbi:MAG TPA: carbohydrate kinase family protein [Candidatus Paceibacterota bacterium]
MHDIITIGSTTYDSYYRINFKTTPWKTPTGKAYIIPTGEKFGIEDAYATLGGNAANAAVTFARHGFKTAVMARIGFDAEGEEIKKRLKKERIETKFIKHSLKAYTARSVLLLQKGERTILSYHGAINEFSLKDIDFKNLKAKWIYVSLPGDSYTIFSKLVREASKRGIRIAVNPSFKHLSEGKKKLLQDLKYVSVLFVNDGEASELTGIPFKQRERMLKKLTSLINGIAVITLGPEGVIASDGRRIYSAGIFKEKMLADRTGAGDSFGSGMVAALMDGGDKKLFDSRNIERAIRFATANSTSNVEHIGATEGVLTKNEFDKSSRWRNLKIRDRIIN